MRDNELEEAVKDALAPYSLRSAFNKSGCKFPFVVVKTKETTFGAKDIPPNKRITITGHGNLPGTFKGLGGGMLYLCIRGESPAWRLV